MQLACMNLICGLHGNEELNLAFCVVFFLSPACLHWLKIQPGTTEAELITKKPFRQ